MIYVTLYINKMQVIYIYIYCIFMINPQQSVINIANIMLYIAANQSIMQITKAEVLKRELKIIQNIYMTLYKL